MISLKTAETIIAFVSFAFAYIVSTTTSGYAQAWAAHKMGDDTPAQVGYYSWDPFVHVDPLGALFFMYAGIGWVRFIPLNPLNLPTMWRRAVVYLSRCVAYFFVALSALILLLRICGTELVTTAMKMAHSGYLSLNALAGCVSADSSWMLALTLLLVVMIYLSIIMGVLSLILDGFRFVAVTFFPDNDLFKEGELMSIIIPLFFIIFFTYSLRMVALNGISYLGFFISSFLGAS
ncbi:MAG TPA: hypothetical protein VHO47_04720 [Candidatus Babeliales bacterium]|nr:hypothetical protein [Candidatus Babeliales bacterium]